MFIKSPNDTIDYEYDWSIALPTGDTIAGVTWTAQSGISLANINPPTNLAAVAVGTGGTFAAGSFFWKITAINSQGETTVSNEATATLVLNGSATLTWNQVTNATGYKVYRGTSTGAENHLITTIGSGSTLTYTDTGTVGSAVSPPGANTAIETLFAPTNATAWVTGGTAGNTYTLTCQVTTAAGRIMQNTQNVNVVNL